MKAGYKNNSDLSFILDKCMENCNIEWECPEQNIETVQDLTPQTALVKLPNADMNNSQEIDLEYAFKLGANIKALVDNILNNASNVDVKPDNTYSYIFDNHQIVQDFISVNNTLHSLDSQLNSILDALNNQYISGQSSANNASSTSDVQILTGDIQI